MDNRITGLLDLAEALKDNPPATTYPDQPLAVYLNYASRDEAVEASAQYGATVRLDAGFVFIAAKSFAQEQGNFYPGAELFVQWSR